MTMKSTRKILHTGYFYLLSFMVIVSTRGIWLYERDTVITYGRLSVAITIFSFIGVCVFSFKNRSLNLSKFVATKIVICLFLMTIYFFFAGSNRYVYLQLFAMPIICAIFLFCLIEEKLNFWKFYSDVVIVLAIISLVFYFGGSIFNIISPTGITTYVWSYTRRCNNYFGLYYESQHLNGLSFSMRNCGIFTEAPMYNIVLCIAFASEMFLNKDSNKIRKIILLITIVTTISTTGYFVIIIIFIMKYIEKNFRNNIMTLGKVLIPVLSLLACVVMYCLFNFRLTYSSGVNSNNVRFDHLQACFSTWFHNFLFGCGYSNSAGVLSSAAYEQGISVGLPYLLATGGIVLGSVLLFPYIYNSYYSIKNKHLNYFFFDTIIIILYFFTAVTGTPIIGFLIAYFITDNKRKLSFKNHHK